jgi:hypothetical protein
LNLKQNWKTNSDYRNNYPGLSGLGQIGVFLISFSLGFTQRFGLTPLQGWEKNQIEQALA